MAIVPTHLYNVTFNSSDLMKVLLLTRENSADLFPQDSRLLANNVKGVKVLDQENPYNDTLEVMYHLLDNLGIEKTAGEYNGEEITVEKAASLIEEVSNQLDLAIQIRDDIIKDREENFDALQILKEISNQNINLDELEDTKYIKCRFGRIPLNEFDKLKYYNEFPFIFKKYSENKDFIWGIYTGLTKDIAEIDNLFNSISFELITLPDFAHGPLDSAISELKTECNAMKKYIGHINDRIAIIRKQYEQELLSTFTTLYNLKLIFDQARYVVDYSNKHAIYVFSTLTLKEVENIFQDVDGIRILQLPGNIYNSKGIHPPVVTKNNFFAKPFEEILRPRCSDVFDPAFLLAIGSAIISAVFLGDLGWGAMLMILGLLFGYRSTNIGKIFISMGIFAFIGGIFYGTVFDTFQVYPAILMTPFEPVQKILYFLAGIVVWVAVMWLIRGVTNKKVDL